MKASFKILFIGLMVLLYGYCFGQEIRFIAKVSSNKVAQNQRFNLEFELNQSGENFSPPNFSQFNVLGGPGFSRSTSIYNGSVSHSFTYSYALSASEIGKHIIGQASIEVNGKTYHTQTIEIEVVKANQSEQNTQNGGIDLSKNVFIAVELSNKNPYQGEQIIATYKLYFNIDVVDAAAVSIPEFNGFYKHEFSTESEKPKPEIINGVQYTSLIIKKVALFAQKSGDLILDPFALDVVIEIKNQNRRQSIWDSFGFNTGRRYQHRIKSNPVEVRVKPLPESPQNFCGLVGQYNITAKISKQSVSANDGVNIELNLKGNGNTKLIKDPNLNLSNDFELFDPKITDKESIVSGKLHSSRTYDYLIIPRVSGEFDLPPFSLSCFDPKDGSYKEFNSDKWSIKVGQSDKTDVGMSMPLSKKEIQQIGKDIRHIHPNTHLQSVDLQFYGTKSFFLLLLLPFALFIGLLWRRNKQKIENHDLQGKKSKLASKMAKKHLGNANSALNKNAETFYLELSKALYGYVADKLKIANQNLQKDHIILSLKQTPLSEDKIKDFIDLLGTCDMNRFSSFSTGSKEEDFEKAQKLINAMEKEIT